MSKDGTIAYASVSWAVNPDSLGTVYLNRLNKAVAPATKAGLTVDYGGGAGQIGQTTNDTHLRGHRPGLRAAPAAVHVRLARSPRPSR